MNHVIGAIRKTLRPVRAALGVLAVLALPWAVPGPAAAQNLLPDDPSVPAEERTPLVFIHGLCGSQATWTGEGGLAPLIRHDPTLAARFKLYHFTYDSAPGPLADGMDCADGAPDHSVGRVGDLARALDAALAAEPGIGPGRPVALVAHSFGGLIARSFMQEQGGAARTQVLVTLATPHHGIPAAAVDDPDGALSALHWDGHRQAGGGGNAWLRCLNGLDPDSDACHAGAASRAETFGRLVAIGLARPGSLGEKLPDDGLVPLQSALLEGAAIGGRYRGLGGQEGGSGCVAHPLAHQAIVDADCLVEEQPPSGRGPEPVLAVVVRALGGAAGEPETAALTEDLVFYPDLIPSAVLSLATYTQPGGKFYVSYHLENDGLVSAGSSTTRFHLSVDSQKSTGDKLLTGTHAVSTLLPGDLVGTSVQVTVPSTVPPGEYFVIACADDLKKVAEASETNNCAAAAQKVTVARPNLRVDSLSNPPVTAAPGLSFTVNSATKNVGSVPMLKTTSTRFYLSANQTKGSGDRLLSGVDSIGLIAAGATESGSVSVAIPATTPPGTYYLLGCADDTKRVTESDEADNCKVSTSQVLIGLPDLIVQTVGNPPAAAEPGKGFTIAATTVNQGTAPALASKTRFYLSVDTVRNSGDKLMSGTAAVDTLLPGFNQSDILGISVPATMPLGTYRLLACADDLKDVAESSETNNCKASATTVNVTRPDLTINTTFTVGDATVPPGGVLTVYDTVQNLGLVSSGGASTTRYWLSLDKTKSSGDKLLVGSRLVSTVGAGGFNSGQVQATVPTSTTPGAYYLVACADAGTAVTELVETNNCKASDTPNVIVSVP